MLAFPLVGPSAVNNQQTTWTYSGLRGIFCEISSVTHWVTYVCVPQLVRVYARLTSMFKLLYQIIVDLLKAIVWLTTWNYIDYITHITTLWWFRQNRAFMHIRVRVNFFVLPDIASALLLLTKDATRNLRILPSDFASQISTVCLRTN